MKKEYAFEISFRIVAGALIVLGVIGKWSLGLQFLLLSGFLSGLYYGYNDDILWSVGRKNNVKYNTHLLWIHIICGLVAAISLYLLSSKINLMDLKTTLIELKIEDTVLFVISLLGYMGLLPRTFWFIANTGKIK